MFLKNLKIFDFIGQFERLGQMRATFFFIKDQLLSPKTPKFAILDLKIGKIVEKIMQCKVYEIFSQMSALNVLTYLTGYQ